MKPRQDSKKIKTVVNQIAKEFKPEKIILFGSWAWGRPGRDSDVDLFVIKDTKNPRQFARRNKGKVLYAK